MSIFKKIKNLFVSPNTTATKIKLITDKGNGYYSWGGDIFKSDIVRSCIRPYAKAVGKLNAKHLRGTGKDLKVNPDPYIRFLLEEPNPLMTGQLFQEKLATQLKLNNNSFAYIVRDDFGFASEMYPLPATMVEALYDDNMRLYLKFQLQNSKYVTFAYTDIIHLRQDFNKNDIFGDTPKEALTDLMEVVTTTDQSVINAIKNSNIVKWLLRYSTQLQPEDLKENLKVFNDAFLDIETASGGAMGVDQTVAEVKQVDPKDYVPNATQMDKSITRIYNFFGTNEKIIQGKYNEDEWVAYYESEIEPIALQLGKEVTRKIFSRKERGFDNRIVYDATSLQTAGMQTKLNLFQMVDRGGMSPNEWREVFNLPPCPGGDEYIRRLDTAVVNKYADIINKFKNITAEKFELMLKKFSESEDKDAAKN